MLENVLYRTKEQIQMHFYLKALRSYSINLLFLIEVVEPQQPELLFELVPHHWYDFAVVLQPTHELYSKENKNLIILLLNGGLQVSNNMTLNYIPTSI